jgi:threonine dehydratase
MTSGPSFGLPQIDAARALLARHFSPTPLRHAPSFSAGATDVFLKNETGLPTGSFKVRGAVYSLSAHAARGRIDEVVAASTGNHGAAIAYAGTLTGIPATIFLPVNANPVKVARIRALGARLVEAGADLSAAIDAAADYCERAPADAARLFLHDATDADIPVGTATIGAEITDRLPEVDAIYVPMGDTALVRGVAAAAKAVRPSIQIVGVAARMAPAYVDSWQSGEAVETATARTIADGLAVRRTLAPNVAAIRRLVDEVRLVDDGEMLDAIGWLNAREQVSAEPAGAAAAAAYLKDAAQIPPRAARRRTVVVLVTGGNIAPEVAAAASARPVR